jgi:hypothetical protein
MAYVMLAIALALLWWGVQLGDQVGPARVQRVGVSMIAAGLLWTAFAWWLVVPEALAGAGIVVFAVGWLQGRHVRARHA